jgi:two-component system, cell cycle response regulator
MPRRATRAFAHLGAAMVGAGVAMGLAFPFMSVAMGVSPSLAFSPGYLAATLAAGVAVGAINFGLARIIVGRRVARLADSMRRVADALEDAAYTGNRSMCDPRGCALPVESDDELGRSAAAFNGLLLALARAHAVEDEVRAFGILVGESRDLRALGDAACSALLAATAAYGAAVTVVTDDGLEVVGSAGVGTSNPIAGVVALEDLHDVLRPVRVPFGGGVEAMLAPLRVRETGFGMVVLEGPPFPVGAEEHLELFLPSLGLSVAAALGRERLERAAERDPLTGIGNRRAGMAALGHALDLARHGHGSPGVLLLDLDHFKRVNDTHGHLVGDQVLIAAAQAMRSALRSGDAVARYGGEEFLVICPDVDRAALGAVGQRLRAAVAGSPYVHEGSPVRITVSVGGASLDVAATGSAEILIGTADQALYAAKRAGRDRVMLAREKAAA